MSDDSTNQTMSPALADQAFRDLFRRLVRFFRYRNLPGPGDLSKDLAQETLRRGLERFAGGTVIDVNEEAYLFGVARKVAAQYLRTLAVQRPAPLEDADAVPGADHTNVTARIHLEQVLSGLTRSDRALLAEYYLGDRQALRARLGVSEGALRVRVHRIRRRLDRTAPPYDQSEPVEDRGTE